MSTKNTTLINLMGGPSSGKTTMAHGLMQMLKARNIDIEYVSEVAKDLVWSGDEQALSNQLYVTGRQLQRIERLMGKVEYIITDSPFFLSIFYAPEDYPKSFRELILELFARYNNINIFVNPNDVFETNGRVHTQSESLVIGKNITSVLGAYGFDYFTTIGTNAGTEHAFKEIMKRIG